MNLVIKCTGLVRGVRLYSVYGEGDRYFTGSLDEVKRFVTIHYSKIRERREAYEAHLQTVRSA
jgi:hypothetical protein